MIRQLKNTDLVNFLDFCSKKDFYNDFYVTENNIRKYLTDLDVSKRVFNKCLKNGDKCYIKISEGDITGVLLITGFSDKFFRKYVSILSNNKKDSEDLFQFLNWKNFPELYMKVQKGNKYLVRYNNHTKQYFPAYALRKAGFSIVGVDKEILLTNKDKRSRSVKS